MKSSQYRELMELFRNRYAAYIRYKESEILGPEISDEESQAAAVKLMQMGYTLYAEPSGVIDGRFFNQALTIAEESEPYLIYCDEDMLDDGQRINPFFKPDFSPDTLESFFYIGGLFLIRENSGDFGVPLTAKNNRLIADRIIAEFAKDKSKFNKSHIPGIYFNSNDDTCYRYASTKEMCKTDAKISCIILSKNNVDMLLTDIDSLIQYSDMSMEYIVVDNGSSDENRARLEKELKDRNIIYIYHLMDFEYSTLCNIGAAKASGELLLFMNDDVRATDDTKCFPSRLAAKALEAHVGAVGVKLLYPEPEAERLIQHAGITLLDSGPSHRLCTYSDNHIYEHGRNQGQWNVLGVTGACLMVAKDKFDSVGGFDELLKVAYTDVDLCLDLMDRGLYNVVLNDVVLLHYESVSRGSDVKEHAKRARLDRERDIFYNKHLRLKDNRDPFSNINLLNSSLDYLPDYTYPWENNVYAEKIQDNKLIFRQMKESQLLHSIDRVSYICGNSEAEGYYEIEGWAIMHNKNQLSLDIAVVLSDTEVSHTDRPLVQHVYKAVLKPRRELLKVFPSERYTLFSGFICRIKKEELLGKIYDIGVAKLKKDIFGNIKCSYIMTDKRIGE